MPRKHPGFLSAEGTPEGFELNTTLCSQNIDWWSDLGLNLRATLTSRNVEVIMKLSNNVPTGKGFLSAL